MSMNSKISLTDSETVDSSSSGSSSDERLSHERREQDVEALMQSLTEHFADEDVPISKLEAFVCDLLETRKNAKTIDVLGKDYGCFPPEKQKSMNSITSSGWLNSWGSPFEENAPIPTSSSQEEQEEVNPRRRELDNSKSRRGRSPTKKVTRDRSPSQPRRRRCPSAAQPRRVADVVVSPRGGATAAATTTTTRSTSVQQRRGLVPSSPRVRNSMTKSRGAPTTASPALSSRKEGRRVMTPTSNNGSRRRPSAAVADRRTSLPMRERARSPTKEQQQRGGGGARFTSKEQQQRRTRSPIKERARSPAKEQQRRLPRMEQAICSARNRPAEDNPVIFSLPLTEDENETEHGSDVFNELELLRNRVKNKTTTGKDNGPAAVRQSPRSVKIQDYAAMSPGQDLKTISEMQRDELEHAVEEYSADDFFRNDHSLRELERSYRKVSQERKSNRTLSPSSKKPPMQQLYAAPSAFTHEFVVSPRKDRPMLQKLASSERNLRRSRAGSSSLTGIASPSPRTTRRKRPSLQKAFNSDRHIGRTSADPPSPGESAPCSPSRGGKTSRSHRLSAMSNKVFSSSSSSSDRHLDLSWDDHHVTSPRPGGEQHQQQQRSTLQKPFHSTRTLIDCSPVSSAATTNKKPQASSSSKSRRSHQPLKLFIAQGRVQQSPAGASGAASIHSNNDQSRSSQMSNASTAKASSSRRKSRMQRMFHSERHMDRYFEDSSESSFDVTTPRTRIIATMKKKKTGSSSPRKPALQKLTRTDSYCPQQNRSRPSPRLENAKGKTLNTKKVLRSAPAFNQLQ